MSEADKVIPKKKRSWWKWALMLSLSIVLLYFAFRGVKWGDFVEGLTGCNYWWIGISMIASILAFLVRGLRWRIIMLPLNQNITRKEAYDGVTIAYLTNFAFPRAGEFARCGVIAATGKASFESVLGTVVLERSWDMLTYVIILFAVIFARWDKFGSFMTSEIWEPLLGKFEFNAIWLIVVLLLVFVIVCFLMYHYRNFLKKRKFFEKMFNVCQGLWNGLLSGLRMKGKWLFLVYTILLWTFYWIMSVSTIEALPGVGNLSGVDALFLMVVGSLGWIVPVQGGIGAYHFILSLALSSIYGIAQTSGVVFATISHESQALTMLVCGAISLASISFLKKNRKFKNQ